MVKDDLNIENFVKKHESNLKWFRRIYKLLDFLAISVFLYIIFAIFNMDTIFSSIKSFELYTGRQYQFIGFSVLYETIVLVIISAVLALIITLTIHRYSDKTGAIQIIESKYPELRERLKTAYDNRNTRNIIVNDLINSVLESAKKVSSSDLLNKKKVASGILAVLVALSMLSIIAIYDYDTDIKPVDIGKDIFAPEDGDDPDDLPITDNREDDDNNRKNELQGETSIVEVEGEKKDFKFPSSSAPGFNPSGDDNEDTEPFEPSSANERDVISSKAYYENLPEGHQDVIKRYFEEMAKK
ncbi:MAG: hypothetical protein ACLFMM_02250 [Methanohalobium sp.]|uniref:DUF7502 family protein n=1 Tax=Methanohalobium sp. TaxID=2837493 RepID=UPI00397D3A2D